MKDTRNTAEVAVKAETTISTKAISLIQTAITAICRVCGEPGIAPLEQGEPAYCLAHLPEGRMIVCIDTDTREVVAAYLSLSEEGKAFIRGGLAALIEWAGRSDRSGARQ